MGALADAAILSETFAGSCVAMGLNDPLGVKQGWSAVDDRPGKLVRWVEAGVEAELVLDVPPQATHVGLELWVPRTLTGMAPTLQVSLYDIYVDPDATDERALEVCFRLRPGRWQTVECPLRPYGLGDSTRVVCRLRFGATVPGLLKDRLEPRLGVHRVWLRELRVTNTDVTIVVLNWRRPDDTLACLESLHAAALGGARVLVVDNGSHDDTIERIHARFPDQEILTLLENRGYAGGNNAGIRAALMAGAKAVLLLNNDAVVAPDFLDPLIWVLNSHARIAAVSSATLRPDRETLEVAWLRVHFGHGLIRRIGVHALPSEGYSERREVPVVVGCSLLLAADALREVGAFDEAYFAYHEDVDWCFRARDAGWEVHYQPLSRVYHAGSRSTAALVRPLDLSRNTGRATLPGARAALVESRARLPRRPQHDPLPAPARALVAVGLLRQRHRLSHAARALRDGDGPRRGIPDRRLELPHRARLPAFRPARVAHRRDDPARAGDGAVAAAGDLAARDPRTPSRRPHGGAHRAQPRSVARAAERADQPAPPRTAMKLVILVLNWGQPQATLACLASLRQAELCGGEIVVIDNGSRDGSADILRAADPTLRLVALPENLGYAGGNNVGLRLALEEGADRILVLNNDTTVAPEFLKALMSALDDSPEAAAVCAAVHRLDRPEMLNVAFARIDFLDRNAVKLRGVNALPSEGFAHRQRGRGGDRLLRAVPRRGAARGRACSTRTYFAYHEDIDWSLRASRAGWTLLYEPYARVFHARSGSTALDQLPDGAGGFEPGLPERRAGAVQSAARLPRRAQPDAAGEEARRRGDAERSSRAICLRGLPLEYSAVFFNREGTLQLEKWDYEVLLAIPARGAPAAAAHLVARRTQRPHGPGARLRARPVGRLAQPAAAAAAPRPALIRPMPFKQYVRAEIAEGLDETYRFESWADDMPGEAYFDVHVSVIEARETNVAAVAPPAARQRPAHPRVGLRQRPLAGVLRAPRPPADRPRRQPRSTAPSPTDTRRACGWCAATSSPRPSRPRASTSSSRRMSPSTFPTAPTHCCARCGGCSFRADCCC